MRIAVVNNFFPPRVGGSSHLSHSLAVGYAERGHEVIVITAAYPGAPPYEEQDGIKIYRFPAMAMPKTRLSVSFDMAFATRPTLRARTNRVLKAFGPDVIHQHGQFFDLTWSTGRWARANNVPVLLSVHTRLESPDKNYEKVFRGLDASIVRPTLKRYRPTFVVMDVLMDQYIKARYHGAIGGLVNIPVGVELDRFRGGDPQVVRERHGLAADTPLIASIGHVIQLRDRIALIEALPKVRAHVPNAKLAVIGGVYYDRYLTRAQELGVDDMLINTGAVPRDDVRDYLAAATIESHELNGYGFGTASLEAMGVGVPIVAAVRGDNFPGIPLVDGENIYLFEVGDTDQLAEKVVRALQNPAEAQAIGRRGADLVEQHFTMNAVLDQHLETLGKLNEATAGC
ncbi:glycosyltransferase family 4 protein [Blastococcus sp. Marseille-P5729]|uniref:glycosyltransferase family 4 protein n=1 Tax=Blastococcus sp. Marseille-P5729 TaxID=2086582 RepID=UPI000D10FF96|nr:glycosyltransferase family 4 protein [Blastococcus sp. Marseille-P5729]